MLVELAKVHLIKLKLLLRYRKYLVLTIIHILLVMLYVFNSEEQKSFNEKVYIEYFYYDEIKEMYTYYAEDVVFTSSIFYNPGSKVHVIGSCMDARQTNFIKFDYSNYLKSEGYKCFVSKAEVKKINSKKYLYIFREKIRKQLMKSDVVGMKQQLLLGFDVLDDETKDMFFRLGVAHLIALSGMHIAFLYLILSTIIKKIVRIYEYQEIAILVIIIAYYLITYHSYSINRTILYISLVNLTNIFRIKCSKFNIFLFVVNILLLNPYAIYSLGFIYSSICHLVIITSKIKNQIKLFLLLFFIVLPINILFNNYVNVLTVLYSLLISIAFEIIYFPYIIIVSLIGISDGMTPHLVALMKKIPVVIYHVKPLNLLTTVIYYITVLKITLKTLSKKFVSYAVLACLVLNIIPKILIQTHKIIFLDVGQGNATLIILNDGTSVLIDTGGIGYSEDKNYDLYKYSVKPVLKSHGINTIDYLILSHGDFDHIGLASYVQKDFSPKNTLFNCNKLNDLEKNLEGVRVNELEIFGYKYHINVMCKAGKNENESSLVVYANLNGFSFLSLGDRGDSENSYKLQADILQVSHHGSKTSSSKEFIKGVNPTYAVISVGNNFYGHPHKEVLDNLSKSKIFRTDIDGSVKFIINYKINVVKKLE